MRKPVGSESCAMIRSLISAGALALLASTAFGAEKEKPGAGSVGQYVELQPVGLPIVADGVLVNYVFVYIRVNLTGSADVAKLREREPYFRDALVRAGHRSPFTLKGDYGKIDAPRLIATLTRDVTAIVGPGQIKAIVITSQQPRRRVTMPRT
jgi:hypothetical protein